jgi:hypothetical protein
MASFFILYTNFVEEFDTHSNSAAENNNSIIVDLVTKEPSTANKSIPRASSPAMIATYITPRNN